MTKQEVIGLCGELRGESFWLLQNYAIDHGARCIIETGTYRGIGGDGESTVFLATVARDLGADFYSVDINQETVNKSKAHMEERGLKADVSCVDSVALLSCFGSPIDVLYLDSYDFSPDAPLPAQIHQLAEIGAAYGKLASHAAVLLDDCGIVHGGKGRLTSAFLLERGWRMVYDKYQRLFVR